MWDVGEGDGRRWVGERDQSVVEVLVPDRWVRVRHAISLSALVGIFEQGVFVGKVPDRHVLRRYEVGHAGAQPCWRAAASEVVPRYARCVLHPVAVDGVPGADCTGEEPRHWIVRLSDQFFGLQFRPRVARAVGARAVLGCCQGFGERLSVGHELICLGRDAGLPWPAEVIGNLEPDRGRRRQDKATRAGFLGSLEYIGRPLYVDLVVLWEEIWMSITRTDDRGAVEDRQRQRPDALRPRCIEGFGDGFRVCDVGGNIAYVFVLGDFFPRRWAEIDNPDRLGIFTPHQQVLHDPACHESCMVQCVSRAPSQLGR